MTRWMVILLLYYSIVIHTKKISIYLLYCVQQYVKSYGISFANVLTNIDNSNNIFTFKLLDTFTFFCRIALFRVLKEVRVLIFCLSCSNSLPV